MSFHGQGPGRVDTHFTSVGWLRDALRRTVLPNIQLLLKTCRGLPMEVIFARIASLTPTGRENNWRYRAMGFTAPLGSKDAEILDDIAPLAGELVVTKNTSGAFASTNLDKILARFGVEHLVVCGVVTHGCVETTVREAADRGYKVLVLEDACADYAPELHETSLAILDGNFANVVTTADALRLLQAAHEAAPA